MATMGVPTVLDYRMGPPEKDDIPHLVESMRGRSAAATKQITLTKAEAAFYLWHHALSSPDKKGQDMVSSGVLPNIFFVLTNSDSNMTDRSMAIGLCATLSTVDAIRDTIMYYKLVPPICTMLHVTDMSRLHALKALHCLMENRDCRQRILKEDSIDWTGVVNVFLDAQSQLARHSEMNIHAGWVVAMGIMHKDVPKVDEKEKKKDEGPLSYAAHQAQFDMGRRLKKRLVNLGIVEPLVKLLNFKDPEGESQPAEVREVATTCLWKLCSENMENRQVLVHSKGVPQVVAQLAPNPPKADGTTPAWDEGLDRRASAAGLIYDLVGAADAAKAALDAGAVAELVGLLLTIMGPGGPMGAAAGGGKKAKKKKKGAALPPTAEVALASVTGAMRRLAISDEVKLEIVELKAIEHIVALTATMGKGRPGRIRLNARGILTCCATLRENAEALRSCNTPGEFLLDYMTMHRDDEMLFPSGGGRPITAPGWVTGASEAVVRAGIHRPPSPDFDPQCFPDRPSTVALGTPRKQAAV